MCKDSFHYTCGNYYHPDCLRCTFCDKVITPPKCVSLNNKIYCLACARLPPDSVRCQICDQYITNIEESITPDGFAEPIHKNCFVCYECARPLEQNNFKTISDQCVCSRCYETAQSRLCNDCGKAIIGRYVTDRHKCFHVPHFKCHECETPLQGRNFIMHHNRYYCPEHGAAYLRRCAYCKVDVSSDEVEKIRWRNKYFHKRCFICHICGMPFQDQTMARSVHGRPHCEECFQMRVQMQQCTNEGRNIGKHNHDPSSTDNLRREFARTHDREVIYPRYKEHDRDERDDEYLSHRSTHGSGSRSSRRSHH